MTVRAAGGPAPPAVALAPNAAATVRLSDVLARLLHPTDRMLGACRYVAVEYLPPLRSIGAPRDSAAVITVGNAAREVLFEAAHELAREYGMEVAA